MAGKKKNDISKTEKFDLERETRVLLEEVRHQYKTLAEGHSTVVSKIEEMDKKLQKSESKYFKFEMILEGIKSKTETIDTKVDRIEKELETVKNAVMDVSAVTKDHDDRLKKLEVMR